MKHIAALVLLSVLAACSRQEPDTVDGVGAGNSVGTTDADARAPNSVTYPSTAPAIDAAPTEVAVQRAQEDATDVAQDTEQGTTNGSEKSPPPPSDSPKQMK